MAYRIGRFGWKLAARLGTPLYFRVEAHKDEESGTYWAASRDLDGLAVSADTLDELQHEVGVVAKVLLQAELSDEVHPRAKADLHLTAQVPCAA